MVFLWFSYPLYNYFSAGKLDTLDVTEVFPNDLNTTKVPNPKEEKL